MRLAPKPDAETQPAAAPDTAVDLEAQNPFYRYFMHVGLPVVLSVALHLLVLAGAALYAFDIASGGPRESVGEYEATLTESLADQMRDAFQWRDVATLDTPVAPAVAEEDLPDLTNLSDFSRIDVDALNAEMGAGGLGYEDGLGIGDGALTLLGTGSGAGQAGSGGFGAGLGTGQGQLGRAGIWDLRVRSNEIVYVVDFSGSIMVAVDDLKRELKRSVGRLKPVQKFNVVIFYTPVGGLGEGVVTESFQPRLVAATVKQRRGFFDWIDRREPQGQTEPLEAVQRALAMAPDAIFFFSDGYFDDSVVADVERANGNVGARIYCLVFDELLLQDTTGMPRETDGARRLKRIAEANRGRVKIVTGKDLAR
jgi:hypothetical protein